MKKVLFAATVISHLAAFHKPFIKWFQDRGYEVHALGNSDHGRRDELEEIGVICWDIPFTRSPFSRRNWESVRLLKQLFSKQKYSLIHVHTPIASFLVRFIANKNTSCPVIYTAHGFHFFKGAPFLNWLLYYPLEKFAARWTDALIVMNQEDFDLGVNLGFQPNKSLYNVNGVGVNTKYYTFEESNYDRLRSELGINKHNVVVSCIAELIPRKNYHYLINMWVEIEKQYPHAKLLIIGDGIARNELKSYVREKNLGNVHFLGFRKDVPKILAISDIITLVSKHEGLPRAIMEAMVNGKPVVATNVRGSRDLVEDGETGFLIPLDDVQIGVSAFGKLIEDPSLRSKMGKKGKEKIKDYDLKVVLSEMEALYLSYL